MMCAGCAANVERRLREIDGVAQANVNLAARTVLVTYDPARTSPQAMKEALSGCLQVIYDQNPKAVGGAMPGNDFYYGAA